MSLLRIGAHVAQEDPIAEAQARQAPLVQFFLGDPQSYKGPEVRYAGGAAALRADAEAAGVDLYVHAPYIVNVATTNNRIRIPSRKLLQQHMTAATEIGAKGLIVHGGHVNKDDDPGSGFNNWRKAIEATEITIPLLIMHGTADKATVCRGSQFFYETAGSTDKTLKLYEGHYHDLLNDYGKEGVMADIVSWLATHEGGPAR